MDSKREEYKQERRKDYPILYEKLLSLEEFLTKDKNQWSFLGFTVKDFSKSAVYLAVGIWWGSGFYNKIDAWGEKTDHLMVCNENRDKWATAKYGHPFDCGKPTDGWILDNRGNVNK